jgi:hypothetical protein
MQVRSCPEEENLGTADWVGANAYDAEGSYAATRTGMMVPGDRFAGKSGHFSVSIAETETLTGIPARSDAFHAKS